MADIRFEDDYVRLLRSKGNSTISAWRTPTGEVYYGDTARVPEAKVERVSQTPAEAPQAPAATSAAQAPTTVQGQLQDVSGGSDRDSSFRGIQGTFNRPIEEMDAAELSDASKSSLMAFNAFNSDVATGILSAILPTGMAQAIQADNMTTMEAINARAQALGINIDTQGNVVGMTPEQLEAIRQTSALQRDEGIDHSTRQGRRDSARRAAAREQLLGGEEKQGFMGLTWSREQMERAKALSDTTPIKTPAAARAVTAATQARATAGTRDSKERASFEHGVTARAKESSQRTRESIRGMRDPSTGRVRSARETGSASARNFADGGVIERGQDPADPMAAPSGAIPGRSDDLQRNVSEGEFVIPADVVKAKGVDFFEKLTDSVREAKAKMAEEKAAQEAAQQGQAGPMALPPAPPSNEQPGTTGILSLPQGIGPQARKPIL